MAVCPNCFSENTFCDHGEYVCLDCDFIWQEGEYPENEDGIENEGDDFEYTIQIDVSGEDDE